MQEIFLIVEFKYKLHPLLEYAYGIDPYTLRNKGTTKIPLKVFCLPNGFKLKIVLFKLPTSSTITLSDEIRNF